MHASHIHTTATLPSSLLLLLRLRLLQQFDREEACHHYKISSDHMYYTRHKIQRKDRVLTRPWVRVCMGAGARKAEAVPTTVAKVRNFMLGKEEVGAAPVVDVWRVVWWEGFSRMNEPEGGEGRSSRKSLGNEKQVIQGGEEGREGRRKGSTLRTIPSPLGQGRTPQRHDHHLCTL